MVWVLQYENFPDTPSQEGSVDQQAGTRADTTGSSDAAPAPLAAHQRTRLFGSVMNKLTVKNDTGDPNGVLTSLHCT